MADADFFDDAYHRILAPFHPEEEARLETAALRELLALSQDDRVLDLACGWGRHLHLLREAGHDVVGADLSVPLLLRAAETTPAPLAACSMLALPFADRSFDVVLNLATSLGLFLTDRPAVAALNEVRRVLRHGGRLLIEGMNADDVLADYAERDAWALDDGTVVRARRRFDPQRRISHEVLRWREPDGREGKKRHSLHLRTADQMTDLLRTAGFTDVHLFGDWTGEPFRSDSPRLILTARPA